MPGFVSQPIDLLILAAVAFLILGPQRFAQTMGQVGRWLRELKDATAGLTVDTEAPPPDDRVDGRSDRL